MHERQARRDPARRPEWRPDLESEAPDWVAEKVAEAVIRKSGRELPADAVLRETLRAERGLAADATREISRLVFNYYRWFGWLDATALMERQFATVRDLAERFAREPESFRDADLARAVPEWIRSEMNVTPAWLRSLQAEPRLWLRAKKGQGTALLAKLGVCVRPDDPAFPDALEFRGTSDLFRTPEFHAGEFEVQDLASQAVGLLCNPQPGETWWDACAGEGGKTLHLSDLMGNKGLIWASDRAEWRLKQLRHRAGRAKCFNYRAVSWDGGAKLPTKTKFDGVLVDAPCAGLGTWQRNPHARWTTTPNDVRELGEVQRRLLTHAAPSLKPGGRLIYAVCTLTRAETADVVTAFNAAAPDFEPVPLGETEATLTLWPHEQGGNGMFVAVWRRK
ncbi:MAG: RsmB/NOP family class I SAM-dependent RNA methyltransferase [Verrucomicrobia bacterium]|nr:RsmB/NOP family class I SAM-dependent RNA methyltransferase [Verrucomicrobiota bacterium]